MRLQAALAGDLQKAMRDELAAGERAAKRAMTHAGEGLKDGLRGQVRSAGLGGKLANTWRSRVYPTSQPSLEPAALVWSKAPEVVRGFDEGTVIRGRNGLWLAIPTKNAPARGVGGKRINPSNFPEHRFGRLRFVYRRTGPSLLVVDNLRASVARATGALRGFRRASAKATAAGNVATVVMFILVRQVRMRKRLDVQTAARRWQDRLPDLVSQEWAREDRGG